MPITLSVINQKGGVGKTTTAINLAAGLALQGIKTLLVDLDPQGNASSGVGARRVGTPSLYAALTSCLIANGEEDATPLLPEVQPTAVDGLDVLAADPQLAGAEVELATRPQRDYLRRVLEPFAERYAVIVVDTPPSLSVLTIHSLAAATHLIIPVQCEYYALEGLGHLLRTLEMVKRQMNPDLRVLGILRTMYDGRLGLGAQVSRELERHFPQLLFETLIPRNVRLAEAPSFGQPIAFYDKRSQGAGAYWRLTEEVIERLGLTVQAEATKNSRKRKQRREKAS